MSRVIKQYSFRNFIFSIMTVFFVLLNYLNPTNLTEFKAFFHVSTVFEKFS